MFQQFHSSGSAFANISNERLNEITKFTVFGLGDWRVFGKPMMQTLMRVQASI